MKTLLAALLLTLSTSGFCYSPSAFEDVPEKMCPGLKEISRDVALCTKVAGASKILKASSKNAIKVDNYPEITEFYNAVELGIWPDDSTDMMYSFSSILKDEKGAKIGYRIYHAYNNTEMESQIKLESRFNLQGQLTSIEIH